jgi:hypothetical protein
VELAGPDLNFQNILSVQFNYYKPVKPAAANKNGARNHAIASALSINIAATEGG